MAIFESGRIPPLDHDDRLPLGPAGRLQRSYPTGRGRLMRAWLDGSLPVIVTVKGGGDTAAARVVCAPVDGADDEVEMQPIMALGDHPRGRRLRTDLHFRRAGLHWFRVKYTVDGRAWFWDRADYGYVLVDPPRLRNMRMYSFIPAAGPPLAEWPAEFKRLHDLGFNAVHLLPLTPTDTSGSPYAARHLFGIDDAYLGDAPPDRALALWEDAVTAAEDLGLHLCLDLVLNHVGVHSAVARERPDWLVADETEEDGIKRAGWSDGTNWYKWEDLALLNYNHPAEATRAELWEYMYDYAAFWAGYAERTGGLVRLDNLHSTPSAFLTWFTDRLRDAFPELAVLGELFRHHHELVDYVGRYGLNLLLGTSWEHHFVPQLRNFLDYVHKSSEQIRWHLPVTSHDSGTPAKEFGSPAAVVPRYVICTLMGAGQTGLCHGTEWGLPEQINFRAGQHTEFPHDLDYTTLIRAVNDLAGAPALQRPNNLRWLDDGHEAVMAVWREDPETRDAYIVVANLDIHGKQTLRLDLARHGFELTDARLASCLDADPDRPAAEVMSLTLPPCGAKVFHVIR